MFFRQLTIIDKKIIDKHLEATQFLGSDFCFGSWFSWYNFDKMQIAETDNNIFIRAEIDGESVFLPPLGSDFCNAVAEAAEYCRQNDTNFKMVFLNLEQATQLETNFVITESRDNAEYIYSSEDLIQLKGKKYHSKRNHIAKFKATYNYEFKEYKDNMLSDAVKLVTDWVAEKGGISNEEELLAMKRMLNLKVELGLFADVLFCRREAGGNFYR
jgi:hypothetical protein